VHRPYVGALDEIVGQQQVTDQYRTLHDFSHTSWKRENVKFDMRATKLVGSARVKVTCNPSPVAVSGQLYTPFTAVASGGKPPYYYYASGLPNGLTINSSTGVVSGTPYIYTVDSQLIGGILINARSADGRVGASQQFSIFVASAATVLGSLGNQYVTTQDGALLDLSYNLQILTQSSNVVTDDQGNPVYVQNLPDSAATIVSYPVINGSPYINLPVSVTPPVWANPPFSLAYQWYQNSYPIPGATSLTFSPTNSEVGAVLTLVVIANGINGIETTVSAPSSPVLAGVIGATSLDFSVAGNSANIGIIL